MTTSLFRLFLSVVFLFPLGVAVPAMAQNVETLESTDEEIPASSSQEVTLETNVVTILLNAEHRDGVDWSAIVSDFHSVQLKKEDNPIWVDKKYKLSVGTVSDEDYVVLLEALDTVGHMSQLAHPALKLNLNEKTDQVLSGEMSLSINMSRPRGGEGTLGIEPHLTLAKLLLKARTEVPLKNGTTIVIGGIFKEEEITKTHKFPLLGDLPIVGFVFRSRGRLMQRTETVIFLNVHIKEVADVASRVDEGNGDN